MRVARQIDCLIVTGTAAPQGPQYLASSTVLALAKACAAAGNKTAILAIDPLLDPALVDRDLQDGITIFRNSQPVSTLSALSYALGGPRVLILPNQLAAYRPLQTPDLDAVIWLGEDDLAQLGQQSLAAALRFWADSDYVAAAAASLLQLPVTAIVPPLGFALTDNGGGDIVIARPNCVAVVGARPRDGIALVLALAEQRRDLRFLVIDWPYLTETERQHVFARAARIGNIDWRRPDSPAALIGALLEAAVILAPVQQPIGHRDWIQHCRRAGRHLLASDLGALPALIGAADRLLAPTAAPASWLQQIDQLRQMPVTPGTETAAGSFAAIVGQFLSTPA
ncbi:MAG TPA: hypothetical protein VN229_22810 [Terriglobales bacterium]|nr:hypothetical protein [Terriglobales bacterium]